MVESAAAVERGGKRQAMLNRLAELGMTMAEAIVAQTAKEGAAEAGAAFAKVAQAVRYTVKLEADVANGTAHRRTRLADERAERKASALSKHARDKQSEIDDGVSRAIYERHGDGEAAEALEREVEELLIADDFLGYEDRPVGETIARLCQALGLDPDFCVEAKKGWKIKNCPPTLSELAPARAPEAANADPPAYRLRAAAATRPP